MPAQAAEPKLTPPELVAFVAAAYPPAALSAQVSGTVKLVLTIDAQGSVSAAEVVAAPSEELGQAARAAAEQFRFRPALRGESPVASRIVYEYRFELPPTGAIEGTILLGSTPQDNRGARPDSPDGLSSSGGGGGAAPAPSARVRAVAEDGKQYETLTDADGRYRFEGLPSGRYVLTATLLGAGEVRGAAPVVAGQTTRGTLVIATAAESMPMAEDTGAPTPDAGVTNVTVHGLSQADRLRESAQAVKVVETETAQRESADMAALLARTPGVGVRRTGGLGSAMRFSLNGLSGNQVRVFLDGVPLEFTAYSLGLANVPVNLIERVEVHAGVVPIQLGADALGGAVNLVSAPLRAGAQAAASYQIGSFDTQRGTAAASYHHRDTGAFIQLSGFADSAANDYAVDVEVPNAVGRPEPTTVDRFHDGYRAHGARARLGWVARPWAERLSADVFVNRRQRDLQNNFDMSVPYGEANVAEWSYGASLHYRSQPDEPFGFDAVAGYSARQNELWDLGECVWNWRGECARERELPGELSTGGSNAVMRTSAAYARLHGSWWLDPWQSLRVTLAPTWVVRTGEERSLAPSATYDPLDTRRNLASVVAGAEHRWDLLSDRLQSLVFAKYYLQSQRSNEYLATGIPVERNRVTSRPGLGGGVRYHLTEDVYAKASYEWATRLPTPDELFGDGVLLAPNLELEPELSHNFNLGLGLSPWLGSLGTLSGQITGFLRDADQLILLLPGEVDQPQQHRNVYSARSTGFELMARWATPAERLSLEGNLTYQQYVNTSSEGAFADYEGDRVPNQPWLFGNVSVRLMERGLLLATDELSLTLRSRRVQGFLLSWESIGRRDSKLRLDDQLSHDAVLTYLITRHSSRVVASLEVDNLTGERVFDFYGVQRPGRSFNAKVAVSY